METPKTIVTTESLRAEIGPIKAAALALVITSSAGVALAKESRDEIKRRLAVIDAHCDPGIKQAHTLHKQLLADKATLTKDLNEADDVTKKKMTGFQLEQERLAREAQQKAQREAEALRLRQVAAAEKKFDTMLAKAGTIQEKIDAVTAVIEDEATTDTELALAERQLTVLQLQQQGLEDKARAAQEKAVEIAEAPAYIPQAAVVEKVKGVSFRKTYIIASIDDEKLMRGIVAGKGSFNLVKQWDETAIKKLGLMGIFLDGVSYVEDKSVR